MIIIDASSIILLAKASILETVTGIDKVLISDGVYKEVSRGKETGKPDSLLLERLLQEGKINLKTADKSSVDSLKKSFGIFAGENETISIAQETGARFVLIDDRKGINVCKALNLPFMTAIDVNIDLYENKLITFQKALDSFEKIKKFGWIGQDILDSREKRLKERRSG